MTASSTTQQLDFGFRTVATAVPGPEPEALFETAIAAFETVLATHPVVVAWSGGKDSTAVTILALLALQRMQAANVKPVARLHILHGDTGVENPTVRALAATKAAQLRDWCTLYGHDVELIIAEPRLADAWVVNVLSGGQLPTYPNSRHRTCTAKLKIDPARAALRQVRDQLTAAGLGKARVVTAIGTRFDESHTRRRNMEGRGEKAATLAEHDGRLLMSPIAEWSEETVWELVGSSGTAMGVYPVWAPDFRDVVAAYRDAASGECPVVAGAGRQGRTGCGARFGCCTCLVVRTDKSLEAMAADERHAHLRPLLAIRDHMMAIRYDWSRRSWLTRHFAGSGHDRMVKVQPDHFNGPTLLALASAYLYADYAEAKRADTFDRAVHDGRIPDDAYIRACSAAGQKPSAAYVAAMRQPQFQLIDDRKLVALDFYSAMLRKHARPHAILEAAYRIRTEGWQPPALDAIETPASPAPTGRWIRIGEPYYGLGGLGDQIGIEMASVCHDASEVHRHGAEQYTCREAPAFDVDEEAAGLAIALLYPDDWRKSRYQNPDAKPHHAVQGYLRAGIVALSPQGRSRLHTISKARQHLEELGLYDLDPATLLQRCDAAGPLQDQNADWSDTNENPSLWLEPS